jgi:predicted nucleotidyltransferase
MAENDAVQETLRAIVKKLLDGYAPSKVVFFGSRVNGTPKRDSDIDLLIIKETKDRFIDRWFAVQKLLTGIHGTYPVDTLVLTPKEVANRLTVGDQFIQEIMDKGVVLYGGA